jgi:hypothetical protein
MVEVEVTANTLYCDILDGLEFWTRSVSLSVAASGSITLFLRAFLPTVLVLISPTDLFTGYLSCVLTVKGTAHVRISVCGYCDG